MSIPNILTRLSDSTNIFSIKPDNSIHTPYPLRSRLLSSRIIPHRRIYLQIAGIFTSKFPNSTFGTASVLIISGKNPPPALQYYFLKNSSLYRLRDFCSSLRIILHQQIYLQIAGIQVIRFPECILSWTFGRFNLTLKFLSSQSYIRYSLVNIIPWIIRPFSLTIGSSLYQENILHLFFSILSWIFG